MDFDTIKAFLSREDQFILTGGAAGGFLALLFMGEKVTLKTVVATMVAAVALAYFGTRQVAVLIHLDAGAYGLIGFGIGLVAFSAVSIVTKLLKMGRDDPAGVLAKIVSYIPFLKGSQP